MISTRIYELAHRCRTQGQMNEVLPMSLSDFRQLYSELTSMNCSRALAKLNKPLPSYCGLILSIEAD
ncbi:MAG: hypothetical protein OQK12_05935 [Motiliproteus sp.]|nr:hypothetical protein [Motiliproteus sp.]MCW9051709.1 hypothetical protein [Motiliproteus sp.]